MSEKYRIYVPAIGGNYIAAIEESNDSVTFSVRYPAFVNLREDQTGFQFVPLRFAEESCNLHRGGLLADMVMPDIMLASYKAYAEMRRHN